MCRKLPIGPLLMAPCVLRHATVIILMGIVVLLVMSDVVSDLDAVIDGSSPSGRSAPPSGRWRCSCSRGSA